MDYIDSVKNRVHRVWHHYLDQWRTFSQTWCLRNNRISHGDIQNKRLIFYINHLDLQHIALLNELFFDKMHPDLKILNMNWISLLTEIQRLLQIKEPEEQHFQALQKIRNLAYTFEEDFHSKYDTGSMLLLDKLYQKDFSLLNEDDYYLFNTYMCVQYFRTKNRKKSFLAMQKDYPTVDILRIWNISSYMLASNMAFTIANDGYKHIFLENNTAINFITGDQPVINTYTGLEIINPLEYEPFELYYPLTPKLALLITRNDAFTHKSIYQLNEDDVYKYNDLIFKNSFEQVYSKEKSELYRYSVPMKPPYPLLYKI